MTITNRVLVSLSVALLSIGLAACSGDKPGSNDGEGASPSASQSQQDGQSQSSDLGGVPAASDVLSDRLSAKDNGDGTTTYTYTSAIITTPSTSNQPKESSSEVSWGMTVDVSDTMTVSMSLVKPVGGLSVDSYAQQIASTVGGSQVTEVKVKGAKSANKIILGDGRSVTVVSTNGSTILIGSAVSSEGDIFAAEKIVDTMRFGE